MLKKSRLKNINGLARVNVSFQDDFCGCNDEITTTVRSILNEFSKKGYNSKIGDKILLLEEDVDKDNKNYYIANIGEIVELNENIIKSYSDKEIPKDKLVKLNDKYVMIKIDRKGYFDIYDKDLSN